MSDGNIVPWRGGSAVVDSSSGGPHDPGMEYRVARLEDQFSRIEKLLTSIDERVHKLEIDLSELKGRIAYLPSTWAMITTVLGGQVVLVGLLFGALKLSGTH